MSVQQMAFSSFLFFFFNDTATTEIYTLSLHDALPIYTAPGPGAHPPRTHPPGVTRSWSGSARRTAPHRRRAYRAPRARSEEHTSELQSQSNLVCRLLLEKKKTALDISVSPHTSVRRAV